MKHTEQHLKENFICFGAVRVSDMNENFRVELSTTLSYHLRHNGDVTVDNNGWVEIPEILTRLNNKYTREISQSDLEYVAKESKKQRFQIENNRIRALYGHNTDEMPHVSVEYDLGDTPDQLYHGTPKRNLSSIKQNGIQPQSRNKVHLTPNKQMAIDTGYRHVTDQSEEVVLLEVDPSELAEISNPTEDTFVCNSVPPESITVVTIDK